MKNKYKSQKSSVENVKRFFAKNPNDDIISVNDVFVACDRNLENVEQNKAWLSNKMTSLTYHNLITPIYSYDGRRKLEKIQLTLNGKKALGRIEELKNEYNVKMNSNGGTVSFADLTKLVAKFKDQNKEYEVTFDVKLRNDKE